MNNPGLSRISLALAGVLVLFAPVLNAMPHTVNYQGLLQEDGIPVDGSRNVTFRIYDSSQGGSMLWEEEQNVTFTDGVFSVLLGSTVPIPASVFGGGRRWLSVSIDDGAEILPRGEIVSVGYAFHSESSDSASRAHSADEAANADRADEALDSNLLDGKDSSEFAGVNHTHDSWYYRQNLLKTSDGTAPNVGSNFVHWDILTGVPSGFADGVDDTGAPGVTDHGQLTGLLDNDHPQYALLDSLKISDGSPPNTGRNMVNWNVLTGVPTGFADGTDNVTTSASDIVSGTMSPERIAGVAVVTTDGRLLSVSQKNALTGGGVTALHSHVEIGDISSVTAGEGLSGGGTTDGVILSHAEDASSLPFAHHYPPFVAHTEAEDFSTASSSPTVVVSDSIIAPDSGFVYVSFSATQKLDLGLTVDPPYFVTRRYIADYGLAVDQTSTMEYKVRSSMTDTNFWLAGQYVPSKPVAGSAVFEVGPGWHYFYLLTDVALDIDSGAKSILEDVSVTAIYFQYDSSSMQSAILLGMGKAKGARPELDPLHDAGR
jgi:hypothetical protein